MRRHRVRSRPMRALRRALALTCAAATLLGAAAPMAGAQEVAPAKQGIPAGGPADSLLERRAAAVASQLRCPVCQGTSIQDSPSELAQEMKGLVREQLAAGKSEDEVKRYFVDKYGEWILLQPKASGFNLVVYLLPVLGIAAGALVIWRAVRRWTAPAEGAPQG